jgi:hypothetical protein
VSVAVTTDPARRPVADTSSALVEDCVEYVPAAIYFGDTEMDAVYDSAGGTLEGLRAACERFAVDDLPRLREMSDGYQALLEFLGATTAP